MKTHSLPIIAFLALIAASVFLPIGVAGACAGLVVTGLSALLLSDYAGAVPGGAPRRLGVGSPVVDFQAAGPQAEVLPRAA